MIKALPELFMRLLSPYLLPFLLRNISKDIFSIGDVDKIPVQLSTLRPSV